MMTASQHRTHSALLLFFLFALLAGCSTIVKKPEVSQVKRAAIVSLYANERVPHTGGRGVVKDWDSKVRLQVAEDALTTFAGEITRIGWEIVSPDSIIQSKEYQDRFMRHDVKEDSKMGKLVTLVQQNYRGRFFTPAGMMPILFTDADVNRHSFGDAKKDDLKLVLADMAKKLNVDAVIVVQMDYCYGGGTFSLLGTGQAVMTAATSVKAVNQKGDVVINMPDIAVCGGDTRAESESSAVMIQGNLQFTHLAKDNFRKMFIEATRQSAKLTIKTLQEAM